LLAALTSGKAYFCQFTHRGFDSRPATYVYEVHRAYYWNGSAWSEQAEHIVTNQRSTSFGDATVSPVFRTSPNEIALRFIADKTYNAYFWWRATIWEIDSSAPLLP
jgi:hypothetical protein